MFRRIDTWMDHNADLVGYLSALAITAIGAGLCWCCVGIGLQGY